MKILRGALFLCLALLPLPPLAIFGVYVHFARDLPELRPIASYFGDLKTPTTFRAADGQVIGEMFEERRLYVPLQKMPIRLIQAFLAAEDERFFEHAGVDPRGVLRALVANLTAGRIVQGASTLTQQLAKSMLSNERSYRRKVREAILARRMEDIYSKSEILSLYLNQIFLGHNSYGVQAAAQNYFRKNVWELSLGEQATLAVLPPSPSTVNPIRNAKVTLQRRRHVLDVMVENGFIDQKTARAARRESLVVYPLMDELGQGIPYVVAEARKVVRTQVAPDPDRWLEPGYRVDTTAEIDVQQRSQEILVAALEKLDHKHGYRGPVGHVAPEALPAVLDRADSWYRSQGLLDGDALRPAETYVAVVTGVREDAVDVRVTPALGGTLRLRDMRWAGPYREFPKVRYDVHREGGRTLVTKIGKAGDVAFRDRPMTAASEDDLQHDESDGERERAEPEPTGASKAAELGRSELEREGKSWVIERYDETAKVSWRPKLIDCTMAWKPGDAVLVRAGDDGQLRLAQHPKVQGAALSWDPWSGYVRAMVGGTDFDLSEVNRVFSLRQTGSTMKPIYYALAYDAGLRPSYAFSDTAYVRGGFKSTGGSNDARSMLAYQGLTKSRNTVSLRVHEWVTNHVDTAGLDRWRRALGLEHPLRGHRAEILGGDQTLWSMSGAFGLFLTGGLRTKRVLVRKVVDKAGRIQLDHTFFGDGAIGAREALAAMYRDLFERKPRAMRESVAYIMRHNLRQVVKAGTATRARKLPHPVAGKTGSLPFDVWFNGFSHQAVTTVWVGFDRRERVLGRSKKRSGVYGAGPPLETFMGVSELVAAGRPAVDFLRPVPDSIEMVAADPETGLRAAKGGLVLPHRKGIVPIHVMKGEGTTDTIHHAETDF